MPNLLDIAVDEALQSTRLFGKGTYTYATDNPNESMRVAAYLRGGVRPTNVITHPGKMLVALEDARRAGYAPPVDTPPSTGNVLAFSVEPYSEDQYGK